jgi:hypothetical protein
MLYECNYNIQYGQVIYLDDFNNKKLMNTYIKNGFTVNIFKPVLTEKERRLKDIQIKYDIFNIIKDFIKR